MSCTQIHFFFYNYQAARRLLKHRGTHLYRLISVSGAAHQRSGESSQLLQMHRKQKKVGQESHFDKLNCLSHSLKHGVGQQQSLPLHLLSIGKRSIIADTLHPLAHHHPTSIATCACRFLRDAEVAGSRCRSTSPGQKCFKWRAEQSFTFRVSLLRM